MDRLPFGNAFHSDNPNITVTRSASAALTLVGEMQVGAGSAFPTYVGALLSITKVIISGDKALAPGRAYPQVASTPRSGARGGGVHGHGVSR